VGLTRVPSYSHMWGRKLGCKHDGSGITRMAEVGLVRQVGEGP